MGNVQRLQQAILLLPASLVSLTDITASDVVLGFLIHLGPKEVLPQPLQCLKLAKMPCDLRVMVGTQHTELNDLIIREEIFILIEQQALFLCETRSN